MTGLRSFIGGFCVGALWIFFLAPAEWDSDTVGKNAAIYGLIFGGAAWGLL